MNSFFRVVTSVVFHYNSIREEGQLREVGMGEIRLEPIATELHSVAIGNQGVRQSLPRNTAPQTTPPELVPTFPLIQSQVCPS